MKIIPLTKGFEAVVDDCDYESVSRYRWHAVLKGARVYAARRITISPGRTRILYLHQQLLSPAKGEWVDHRDGDGRNNRRENLRRCRPKDNLRAFRRKTLGTSSGFRGVHWDASRKKWGAKISVENKTINLGRFSEEIDAARAYDAAAKNYFGEFATQNL